MTYSLQEVTFSDLTGLVQEAIDTKSFLPLKGDEESFLRSLPQLFGGHPDCRFFVLLENQVQEIGFIVVLPHKEERTLSIGPMYIREQCQGMGLGKHLVEGLIRWAKAEGIEWLFTQTWGENTRSRRVFEGLGFQCVGEEPGTRVNGDSTVKYLLQIEGQ